MPGAHLPHLSLAFCPVASSPALTSSGPRATEEEDVWYEEYAVGGLKVDLRHMTASRMEELLAAVVEGSDRSESRQEIIHREAWQQLTPFCRAGRLEEGEKSIEIHSGRSQEVRR